MEFHRKQRFSIRKYAIGVASVLIDCLVGPMVAADTVTSEEQAVILASTMDTAQTTEENHPAKGGRSRKD